MEDKKLFEKEPSKDKGIEVGKNIYHKKAKHTFFQ